MTESFAHATRHRSVVASRAFHHRLETHAFPRSLRHQGSLRCQTKRHDNQAQRLGKYGGRAELQMGRCGVLARALLMPSQSEHDYTNVARRRTTTYRKALRRAVQWSQGNDMTQPEAHEGSRDSGSLTSRLRHVYWIGGASGSGKSTIARRLADKHGLRLRLAGRL
jgi:hypothetical protein